MADPTSPAVTSSVDVAADVAANVTSEEPLELGGVNSVDVYGDHLAVAIEADPKQDDGYVAFYSVAGGSPSFVSAVKAGALPDKVGFSPDGNYAVVANEGEPSDDYSNDPEGSITVIDVSGGFQSPTVATADFTAFNDGGTKTLTGPVRISPKATAAQPEAPAPSTPWINEIHYDNEGTDSGEFVEFAAPAGFDTTGYRFQLINGNNGAPYAGNTFANLTKTTSGGLDLYVVNRPSNGIQNGAPDGVALLGPGPDVGSQSDDTCDMLLSYEGVISNATGICAGVTSTEMDVVQGSSTPVGQSVQLTGTGDGFGDFSWVAAANTNGTINTGQTYEVPSVASFTAITVAQDLEPEFVAFSADGGTAYATLQENNAVAVIDLATAEVTEVFGLGFKDYSLPGNEIDASDKDDRVNIRNWSVFGTYQPDGFDAYEVNGTTYLVTANEGDGREYESDSGDYIDEIRIKDLVPTQFTDELKEKLGSGFQDSENLGRLLVMTDLGLVDQAACSSLPITGQPIDSNENAVDGCVYENLYSYGARSFTIWDIDTKRPVFDSGSDFEVITAQQLGSSFNASNDENDGDSRSDAKGPEPEAVEIAVINDNTFAFIALERVGGVMVYNITNPQSAEFVQYVNPRDFNADNAAVEANLAGPLGPEDIKFITQDGEMYLLVSNEVSGTLSVYSVTVL